MCSSYTRLGGVLIGLGLLLTATYGVPVPNGESSDEGFRAHKYGNEAANEDGETDVRQLDSIGGGNLLRGGRELFGNPNLPSRQTRQGLDSLSGGSFGNNYVKRYDTMSGGSFGTAKRNFDEMDLTNLDGFHKKNFDEIDRAGFNSFVKKNFDEIERVGFSNFIKRAANGLQARYYHTNN